MIHEASAAERLGMVKLTTDEGYRWMKVEHILGIERSKHEDFTIIKMLIGEASMAPITVMETPEEVLQLMTDVQDAVHVETHDELVARHTLSVAQGLAVTRAMSEAYRANGLEYDPMQEHGTVPDEFIEQSLRVQVNQQVRSGDIRKRVYADLGMPFDVEQAPPATVYELPLMTEEERQAAADAWLRENSGAGEPDMDDDL